MPLPYVEGVLSAEDVRRSAASIAAMQHPWGEIPWTTGQHSDIWNHVEAAMALLVGGEVSAAEKAYAWIPTMQRADGSWPMTPRAHPEAKPMKNPVPVTYLGSAWGTIGLMRTVPK